MAKKIMILQGSPRKNGNTRALVDWFTEGATSGGAEVELVDTTSLNYKALGCTACFGCQKTERYECVIDDEASPILARIPEVDVLVIATPVYFFGPTAQIKVFLDRGYSLFKIDPAKGDVAHELQGKTICLLASGGGKPEDGLNATEQTYRTLSGFIGGPFKSLCVPFAPHEEGKLRENGEIREKAVALGREIAS